MGTFLLEWNRKTPEGVLPSGVVNLNLIVSCFGRMKPVAAYRVAARQSLKIAVIPPINLR
jgi:hypothetical protein